MIINFCCSIDCAAKDRAYMIKDVRVGNTKESIDMLLVADITDAFGHLKYHVSLEAVRPHQPPKTHLTS